VTLPPLIEAVTGRSGGGNGRSGRRTGSIPVALAAWHIKGPADFGFLGSMAGHGVAEFLLTLRPP